MAELKTKQNNQSVEKFLAARKDLKQVLKDLEEVGVGSLQEALKNIKAKGTGDR